MSRGGDLGGPGTRDFGCGRYENLLSGAISWLTFSRAEQLTTGEAEVIGGGNSQNRRFVLKKEKFTSLLHHVDTAMLRTAFYAMKRDAAPGVDGMIWVRGSKAEHTGRFRPAGKRLTYKALIQ